LPAKKRIKKRLFDLTTLHNAQKMLSKGQRTTAARFKHERIRRDTPNESTWPGEWKKTSLSLGPERGSQPK